MHNRIPELLAPAGGRAQLEAAVNNGADAVYMGGSLFNARINAENFTEESLAEAIDWAHERGVKTYITFNTLLNDSELERAFRYACRLHEMGADALIIQDMGLARLVRRYLPDFPMHLSTQGTVYNVQALDLVRRLGFKRAVPARELSLEEIGTFCREAHREDAHGEGAGENPLEVEVFVHGALCMCYSGQCQMSRAFGGGGRSGNRGLCAQPCRLLYTDDRGRKGYFLSPKDLCALELIPQLVEAGVDSFKIEGRIKSAEYVAVTTAVYRKYLDIHSKMASRGPVGADEWKTMIDPSDMDRLKRIFNRGGFTTGYLEGNPGDEILSGESPKNQGVYIGTVTGTMEVKGKGRDKILADVRADADGKPDVSLGDGVEVRRTIGGMYTSGAAVVTGSSVVTFAEKKGNNTIRIGDFDRSVRAGDRAYKVTDKALREEARAVPEKKLPVSMKFRAFTGRAPELEIRLKDSDRRDDSVRVQGAFAVENAVNKPLTEDRITAQLVKLGGTCFSVDEADIEIKTDRDIMIPASVMNAMRRSAAEELAEVLRGAVKAKRRPMIGEEIDEAVAAEELGSDAEVRRVEKLSKEAEAERKMVLLPAVTKGEADRYIEENFDAMA
ncbi:MAG: peptidase U32 family protein, partial [Bacillota bacterium]